MKIVLFLLFLINSSYASTHWQSKDWLSLLRYRKKIYYYKSDIINKEYFLSPNGQTDPKQEFEKTVEVFNTNVGKKLQCLYPARAILLSRLGKLTNAYPLSLCQKLSHLKKKLKLNKVSMIFSSYYINSPASVFGHTFLRLRSKDSVEEDNDLLDFGLDFAAQVTTNNPIMYGILGITGGFRGRFKLMPYYYKVREYNNLESRDLWDFALNFNDKELDYFVAQLIELELAKFDYFYLTQNCSYHILALINATKPSLNLLENLGVIVPPVDTLFSINKDETFISKSLFRPSIYKKMLNRIHNFSTIEKKLFKKILNKKEKYKEILNTSITETQKLNILESYSNYIDYKDAKIHYGKRNSHYKKSIKEKIKFNSYRSTLNGIVPKNDYQNEYQNSPLLGHRTRNIKLSIIRTKSPSRVYQNFLAIDYRVALHDYLQTMKGYIPFSTTEMGKISFTINKEDLRLNKAELINVEALRPKNIIGHKMSWKFAIGIKDNLFTQRQNFIPYVKFAMGIAYRFNDFLLAPFIISKNSLSSSYSNTYKLDIGPNLLIVYNNGNFSSSLNTSLLRVFNQEFHTEKHLNLKSQVNINNQFSVFINVKHIEKHSDINHLKVGTEYNF